MGLSNLLGKKKKAGLTEAQAEALAERRRTLKAEMERMKEQVEGIEGRLRDYVAATGTERVGCLKVWERRLAARALRDGQPVKGKELERLLGELSKSLPQYVRNKTTYALDDLHADASDTDAPGHELATLILERMGLELERPARVFFKSV